MNKSRASLDALRQKITIDWTGKTQKEAHDLLVQIATKGNAETLSEQTQRSGITPGVNAYANSPGNANLDSVVLPGPIVYKYDYRREIVDYAIAALRKASPVVSGKYQNSHQVYINGAAARSLPDQFGSSDEIIISNPVPYARRLEVGRTKSGRSFVAQVQPRIYERVAKSDLLKRFGNLAKISFDYVDLTDAWVTKARLSASYGTQKTRIRGGKVVATGEMRQQKRRQFAGQKVRAPAIIIEAYT